ncbi:uridine kinase family protein [Larkinella sp. VNQ87]|uniref:uridine kinase family protein n=1 Tax=Larkinella sp. VNQ87 TaxID=3400921 RepID=UPI003C074120
MTQKPFIVGITGGSASGKTSFLKGLIDAFTEDEICLISQDNYYKTLDQIPRDEIGVPNFDLPETIDHVQFADHIRRLHEGKTVETQEYTFNNPNAVPKKLLLRPTPIIVVEGIFVFHFEDVSEQLDLKIFINATNKIKFERRMVRDQAERALSPEMIKHQWEYHVRPTYREYIKPHKAKADLVIPNNHHYQRGLEVVIGYLKGKVATLPSR